jgi:hypothetical protein
MLILRNDQSVKVWAIGKDDHGNKVELGTDVAWESSNEAIAKVRALQAAATADWANQRSENVKQHEEAAGAEILSGDELGTCQITVTANVEGEEISGTIEVKVIEGTAKTILIETGEAESAIEEQPSVTPPPGGPVNYEEELQRPEPRKKQF